LLVLLLFCRACFADDGLAFRLGGSVSWPQVASLDAGIAPVTGNAWFPLVASVGITGTKVKLGVGWGNAWEGLIAGGTGYAAVLLPYIGVGNYEGGRVYFGAEVELLMIFNLVFGLYFRQRRGASDVRFSAGIGLQFGDML
jgi:hypothetical protein